MPGAEQSPREPALSAEDTKAKRTWIIVSGVLLGGLIVLLLLLGVGYGRLMLLWRKQRAEEAAGEAEAEAERKKRESAWAG